jgi:hypothetical protein
MFFSGKIYMLYIYDVYETFVLLGEWLLVYRVETGK